MILAFDTETTGLDLHHGATAFLATACTEQGPPIFWEWDVDPITRQVDIPEEDLLEIRGLLNEADEVICHNGKFDAAVMRVSGIGDDWPWEKMHDTLLAGHLLGSNLQHNLTAMGIQYLRCSIQKYEDALEVAVKQCRQLCRQKAYKDLLGEFRVAKFGDPMIPSAKKGGGSKDKDKVWKFDLWLPRTLARRLSIKPEHKWWTVLSEYACADSQITVALWPVLQSLLFERDLWDIYLERRKCLRVAYNMERDGVTVNKAKLDLLREEYTARTQQAAAVCVGIADSLGYDLNLPKGANNDSLLDFCFGKPAEYTAEVTDKKGNRVTKVMKDKVHRIPDATCLNLPVISRTDSGAPSLNKDAMNVYEVTLSLREKSGVFIKRLQEKRKRDTSISYMNGYERFWLPWIPEIVNEEDLAPEWFVLHPILNPTGTDTLRWSCNNPNEQNISKQGIDIPCQACQGGGCGKCKGEGTVALNLRYCFGPAPGEEWWSFDAKNIELRLPAYEAQEQEMIALFERSDDPPYFGSNHLLISHIIHERLFEQCLSCTKCLKEVWVPASSTDPNKCCKCRPPASMVDGRIFKKRYAATWYQWIKNGNFAVQYGAVNKPDGTGTADRAYHMPGGQTLVESRFGKMKALNQWCINFANRHGYIETIPDKTVNPKHGYPLLCSRSSHGDVIPTVPLNYRIQGTAMWWTMKAMNRVQVLLDDWRGRGFKARIVMQVHDELVVAMEKKKDPRNDIDKSRKSGIKLFGLSNLWRARAIQRLMEQGGDDLGIPTPVGCEWHDDNWSEGVTL